jgi:hypothetical protein
VSETRSACEQLLARYHRLIDVGAASDAAALFAADAVLEVGERGVRGLADITRGLAARQSNADRRTLHMLAGFDFEQADEDTAAASGALVVFAGNGGPISRIPESLSRYEVGFRRDHSTWRIAELRVTILDSADGTR